MAKPTPHRVHLRETRDHLRLQARFIANLRRLREARGWTQDECADRADMLMQAYQRIETGRSNVTLVTLSRLVSAFGVDVQEFFVTTPVRARSK